MSYENQCFPCNSSAFGLLESESRGYYLVQIDFWPIIRMVSSDFCTLNYHFVFFGDQLSTNFLQIAFFGVQNCSFFRFPGLKSIF